MKKVLIVDDNPIITKIYRERFAQAGYQAETAENGFMAMKALIATRPDIVLLDLMMPIMHGVDVLRYIRATPELKATPVIILSEAYMSDLALEAAKDRRGTDPAQVGLHAGPAASMPPIRSFPANRWRWTPRKCWRSAIKSRKAVKDFSCQIGRSFSIF